MKEGKGRVVPVYSMKAKVGVEELFSHFSLLQWLETNGQLDNRPLYNGKKSPFYHRIGDWEGLSAYQDVLKIRIISYSYRD